MFNLIFSPFVCVSLSRRILVISIKFKYGNYLNLLSFCIMELAEGVYDFRLENDSTMIINGPSKAGKSSFVLDMIKHKDGLFRHPVRQIWWFYGIESPFHDNLKALDVHMKQGLPSQEDFSQIERHDLVILDDLQQEAKSREDITNLFLKATHHKEFFAIQINQYIYGDKEQRMRNSNAHYFVAFNNPRNQQQLGQFVSKMFPKGNVGLIYRIFHDILRLEGKYGYLFIDFTPQCDPSLRLRTNLFKPPMSVFKLSHDRASGKMDFSRMVVIPQHAYQEQHGGGRGKAESVMMQRIAQQAEEQQKVKDFVKPNEAYVENLARQIIRNRPTVDNVNHFNYRLAAFDKIRRHFFRIPQSPQANKVLKDMGVQNVKQAEDRGTMTRRESRPTTTLSPQLRGPRHAVSHRPRMEEEEDMSPRKSDVRRRIQARQEVAMKKKIADMKKSKVNQKRKGTPHYSY